MTGFLLQWPTLVTAVMYPILVVAYRRLATGEEREVRCAFGDEWDAYAARTPRFVPRRRHGLAAGISAKTPTTRGGAHQA